MGLFEMLRDLPRLLRLLGASATPLPRGSTRRVRRNRRPGNQPALGAGLARRGHPDGAIRQSTGLGVAPGPGAGHSSSRWIWCCACCPSRSAFTTTQGVAAEFVGHPLADAIPLTSIAPLRAARSACRPTPRSIALLPGSRRGEVGAPGGGFRRDGALARRAAPAHCDSSRRWRAPATRADILRARSRRDAPGVRGAADRRPGADRTDRRRCRAGRLGHRESGGGAVQAAHGRRLPSGRADAPGCYGA